MISQGPENIEITSGFGPFRPLLDVHWEGSTAQNDPSATLAVHCTKGFDADFTPYQSTRLSRYNAVP
jgi:hypothetical protein